MLRGACASLARRCGQQHGREMASSLCACSTVAIATDGAASVSARARCSSARRSASVALQPPRAHMQMSAGVRASPRAYSVRTMGTPEPVTIHILRTQQQGQSDAGVAGESETAKTQQKGKKKKAESKSKKAKAAKASAVSAGPETAPPVTSMHTQAQTEPLASAASSASDPLASTTAAEADTGASAEPAATVSQHSSTESVSHTGGVGGVDTGAVTDTDPERDRNHPTNSVHTHSVEESPDSAGAELQSAAHQHQQHRHSAEMRSLSPRGSGGKHTQTGGRGMSELPGRQGTSRLGQNHVVRHFDKVGLLTIDGATCVRVECCPFCSRNLTENKSYSFFVNKAFGSFECKCCHSTGSWADIERFGAQAWKNEGDNEIPLVPVLPEYQQNARAALEKREKSYMFPANKALDVWLKGAISDETLKAYHVQIRRAEDTEGGSTEARVVYPYYDLHYGSSKDHFMACAPRQYREVVLEGDNKGAEEMWPPHVIERGGLFGFNTIFDVAMKGGKKKGKVHRVVLTDDECSAMAVHEATRLPALSLPRGVLTPDALPLLENVEHVVLWLDQPQDVVREYAIKLGEDRCRFVQFSSDDVRHRNAFDALSRGADLWKPINSAMAFSHNQLLDFSELRDDIWREILYPNEAHGVPMSLLPDLNRILKGHRRGELSVLTGPTGAGKTSLLCALSLDLAMKGVRTLWGSFEIKNARLAKKMLCQLAGRNLDQVEEREFLKHCGEFEKLPMHFMRFFGGTDVEHVLDAMEYAVYQLEVQHIIIDNLQFMLSSTLSPNSQVNRWDAQDYAITLLRKFATDRNVHVTLVIHPRKERDADLLQVASIGGTPKATQEADNVLLLQYVNPDDPNDNRRVLQVKKNRFDGERGDVGYAYDNVHHVIQPKSVYTPPSR